jgi:hypothetical protein
MNLSASERIKIKDMVLDLLEKETNAAIFIKWQHWDTAPQYGDLIKNLHAATPGIPNEMLILSVDSDVLYARLRKKHWFGEADDFTQAQQDNVVEILRNNIIKWQNLGLILKAEIDATDGYKIIENSLLRNLKGRVILIGGCPRTGKTTLSVRLVKSGKGFSKISGDYFGEAFSENRLTGEIKENSFELVEKFLEGLLRDAEVYGINSVFEYCSWDFTIEEVERLPFKDKLDVYFLGFPDISVEEIKYNIKHYAKPADWIYHCSDDYIEETAEKIYAHNIILKKQCEKYNYRFVNTGVGEDRDIILNALYGEIIEKN